MDSSEEPDQTPSAPFRLLPPVEFDFLAGQPVPPGLGQTHAPVRLLPPWTGELASPPDEF